jgi:hypothetical protein
MFKLTEYSNDKNYNGYSFTVSNPHEYYETGENATRYCQLHIRLGTRSWSWQIPEFFKPKKQWVDTSQYAWSTPENKGYWEYVQHQYGFYIQDEYIHVHYGIQPGCWSSTDKKNSDHTKLIEIPWRIKRQVRHSFMTLTWNLFLSLNPEKLGREYIELIQRAQEAVPKIKFKFNDFDGEEIIATCYIEERQYQQGTGWFKWLKYFIRPEIFRSLNIQFNKEVGYEKGSWKGGTMGHSINIEYGEKPLDAFKRYGSAEERYKNYGTKNRNFSNIQIT